MSTVQAELSHLHVKIDHLTPFCFSDVIYSERSQNSHPMR